MGYENSERYNLISQLYLNMAIPMQRLIPALIPAYACPEGTRMHILNLGTLNVDEGW